MGHKFIAAIECNMIWILHIKTEMHEEKRSAVRQGKTVRNHLKRQKIQTHSKEKKELNGYQEIKRQNGHILRELPF